MRPRVLAGLWLIVGVFVWNGFFDLYVSRGAREYLQRRAEYELHLAPEPSMAGIMEKARRAGVEAATLWTVAIVASGWMTIWVARRKTTSGA